MRFIFHDNRPENQCKKLKVEVYLSCYYLLDDPVFWDRILLSQECSASPSAAPLPHPGVEAGAVVDGGGLEGPVGTWGGAQQEEHLVNGIEISAAKKFKSAHDGVT